MRKRIQVLGWSLIWSGVFIFGYLGWQLFVTDMLNTGLQAREQDELTQVIAASPPLNVDVIDISDLEVPPGTPSTVEFTPEEAPEVGESFAFIRIPKIGVERVVFEGVDVKTLKLGPGHMPGTPVPGQPGNAVVSGHRTTYGAPFHNLDLLDAGDRIEVETFAGTHVYEVREIQIVRPTDVWVTHPRPGGWLTLTTCHPKYSARQRLIVFAEMVEGPNHAYVQLNTN